jgi:hypothetical protein
LGHSGRRPFTRETVALLDTPATRDSGPRLIFPAETTVTLDDETQGPKEQS